MAARPAPLVLPAPMQGGALRGQRALRAGSARRARRRASPASQARMGSKPARGRAQPRRATHRERNEADGRGHGQRHAHRRLACLRLFDGSDSGVHHRADIEQSSWGGSWVPSRRTPGGCRDFVLPRGERQSVEAGGRGWRPAAVVWQPSPRPGWRAGRRRIPVVDVLAPGACPGCASCNTQTELFRGWSCDEARGGGREPSGRWDFRG